MSGAGDDPIRSERAGDSDVLEALDAFVVALGEQIDLLQEAERTGDLKAAARRARELAADAAGLGFPPLARAAEAASRFCEDGDADAARVALVELTEVASRVRRGHRGAA